MYAHHVFIFMCVFFRLQMLWKSWGQRFQGSLDKLFRRRASLQNITSWGSVVHPRGGGYLTRFFLKGSTFFRPKSCTSASPRHLTFLGGRKCGWSANCWHVGHLLSVCWLTKEDGDTSSPNFAEKMHSTSVHPCAFQVYWAPFQLRSRCDWNSPTRCHTKTWYTRPHPQEISLRFWPKHVNLMILPSKMAALASELGRASVVFGWEWDQFRSQTSPLKWDVDTVYQRLHLRKTTHFRWFHDWSYAQINAANTHDLEEALLTLQVVLQGGLGVIDGRVPQQVMEWLHLRIEIGWLKQTCGCLSENIPLYIFSILIIYYVVYLVVHMGYEQRRETARKQRNGFTKKRPSTGTETSETLLTS